MCISRLTLIINNVNIKLPKILDYTELGSYNISGDNMRLREKLKKLRDLENFTQTELSKKIGISQKTYGRYESGARFPTKENLRILATYFNVSLEYLLDDSATSESFGKKFDFFKTYMVLMETLRIELITFEKYIEKNDIESKIIIPDLIDSISNKIVQLNQLQLM